MQLSVISVLKGPQRLLQAVRTSAATSRTFARPCVQNSSQVSICAPMWAMSSMFVACTAGVRPSCEPPQNGEVVALVADNRIVALYEYHVDKGRFAPRCVFPIGVSRGCSDL